MKQGIALVVLGILGIAQYIYFQFTPLAFNYSYSVTPDKDFGEFGLMHLDTIVTRDWSVGIVGAGLGILLLLVGVFKLKRARITKGKI